jgi:hypothetical protein
VQASIVALVAALAGIIIERLGETIPGLRIIGDALIMGAFIIAITAFLLFMKAQFFSAGQDEIMWSGDR